MSSDEERPSATFYLDGVPKVIYGMTKDEKARHEAMIQQIRDDWAAEDAEGEEDA